MDIGINYLAVVGAAVFAVVLGMLWYGPLFGKMWMRSIGQTKESMMAMMKPGMGMPVLYILQIIGALVMSYVVAHLVIALNIVGTSMALQFAFWTWLGLIATVALSSVLWECKSWKYYCIVTGYHLVALAGITLILAYWR